MAREEDPLLSNATTNKRLRAINLENWLYPHTHFNFQSSREATRHYLSSKAGHYFVLGLVSLDVAAIIADFVINLFKCEKHWGDPGWDEALGALAVVGLVFSTLFLLELLAAIWAFGWVYFHSKFHCFDAIVIIAGFTLDVLLRGPLEEAASLIVILRLWRVFKIIEELSVGASEQIDHLSEQLEMLQGENGRLREEVLQERRKYEGENGKLQKEIEELKKEVEYKKEEGSKKIEYGETPPTPD